MPCILMPIGKFDVFFLTFCDINFCSNLTRRSQDSQAFLVGKKNDADYEGKGSKGDVMEFIHEVEVYEPLIVISFFLLV